MGVEQVRWVIEYSPVDGAAYTVLLVLAVLADDDALISCSHSSLGRDCRLDRGTVARVIKQLVDVGAIEQLDAPAGRRPGCYLLHCAAVQGRSARTVQQLADRTAARSARTVQQLRAPARPDTSNTAMPTPPPDTLTRANTNEQAELFGNYEANASSALADARTARARKGKDASKSKVKSARANERVPREHELVARELCGRVWETKQPKPASNFVGACKIVEKLIEAGHALDRVEAAMMSAPTISTGWLEGTLNRDAARYSAKLDNTNNVSTDRTTPTGRIKLL